MIFRQMLCAAVFALTACCGPAHASFWTNSAGGNFETATNWSPAAVPGATDIAIFALPANQSITLLSNHVNRYLEVNNGTVNLSLSGKSYSIASSSIQDLSLLLNGPTIADQPGLNISNGNLNCSSQVVVGLNGNGILTVVDGAILGGNQGYLAFNVGSAGEARVIGAGSKWTSNDVFTIGRQGTGLLAIQAGGSVRNVDAYVGDFGTGSGTVNISGSGSNWTSVGTLRLGNLGTGNLTVQSGGTVADIFGHIADAVGSMGTATVSGIGSAWNSSAQLEVGYRGTGNLNIQAGGSVSNSNGYIGSFGGAIGQVTVADTGSQWTNVGLLCVGNSGIGTLNIQSGGMVSDAYGFVGYSAGSTGTATVDGSGSTWTSIGGTQVGLAGYGSLTISNGGRVANSFGAVGVIAGSDGIVDISGFSSWTGASLDIGVFGNGQLYLHDGGYVFSNTSSVAAGAGSRGFVSVQGSGSNWTTSGPLTIGGAGQASLLVGAGAQISSADAYMGRDANSSASVGLNGLWFCNRLYVGVGGSANLDVSAGGNVFANGLVQIGSNGIIVGSGGTIVGNVANGGHVRAISEANPQYSGGSLLIDGNYYEESLVSELSIEIFAVQAADAFAGKLKVTGAMSLAGELNVLLQGLLSPGDAFDILDWGTLSGTFQTINLPALTSNLTWDVSRLYTTGVLRVVGVLPGDYNQNGIVDAADYTIWRDTLGQMGMGLAADGNNDNQIDYDDYDVWKSHFGNSAGSGPGAGANTAVPEPTTAGLLVVGMLAMCSRRRATVS